MVEYCVYWLENGEPMHEVFSNLAAAEMYSCAIRGKENVEWVEGTAPGKEKIQRQG